MNEICRTTVVPAPPADEPLYCSVLGRDARWTAASTQVAELRRRSRLSVATALLLAGTAFLGGMFAGGFVVHTIGNANRPRPSRPEVWMFPYPAIGGPERPGDKLFPAANLLGSFPGWIESLNEPVADVTTRQPGSRLRGESR